MYHVTSRSGPPSKTVSHNRNDSMTHAKGLTALWLLIFTRFFITSALAVTIDQQSLIRVRYDEDVVSLNTNYVRVAMSLESASIVQLSADFLGTANFSHNVLAEPLALNIAGVVTGVGVTGSTELQTIVDSYRLYESVDQLARSSDSDQKHVIRILEVQSRIRIRNTDSDLIKHVWRVTVNSAKRSVDVTAEGVVVNAFQAVSVSYDLHTASASVYGMFERGLSQRLADSHTCLGTQSPLERVYFIGNSAAVDVSSQSLVHRTGNGKATNHSVASATTVLISDPSRASAQFVLFGEYAEADKISVDEWTSVCWSTATPQSIELNAHWETHLLLAPNNFDFPVFHLQDVDSSSKNLPFDELRGTLTGIYASPAGCLQSLPQRQWGTIAPTIAHPDVGYAPDTNFFDPDNYITLTALLYSGDDVLFRETRKVIERTAQTMCGIGTDVDVSYCRQSRQRLAHKPLTLNRFARLASTVAGANADVFASNSRSGQLMHHYVSLSPTYESIAGSEQLGPNVFWTLTVLRYVSLSQDRQWALQMLPFIDLSVKFVLSFVNCDINQSFSTGVESGLNGMLNGTLCLVDAPGPLWIDVLVRENFTSDSNAILPHFLRETALFYEYLEVDDTDFVAQLRDVADRIVLGMNAFLWATDNENTASSVRKTSSLIPTTTTSDHFVTQLNRDGQTTRDFVDYDSNLLAVAFGIVTDSDAVVRVLQRVDSGAFTHVRATYCSEIAYTGDRCDCYIVGGSVCGDSVVTLARIGYVDALARKLVRDAHTVREVLLNPLLQDLLRDTYLYERYDQSGQQTRTAFYFEYPALVAIIIREIVYGIDIGLSTVRIDPIEYTPFTYHIGNTRVSYQQDKVVLHLPVVLSSSSSSSGDGFATSDNVCSKVVTITQLTASAPYTIASTCGTEIPFAAQTVFADATGTLQFTALFAKDCVVSAVRVK